MSTLKQVKYPLCVCFIFTFKCSPASGHEGQKAMAKKKKICATAIWTLFTWYAVNELFGPSLDTHTLLTPTLTRVLAHYCLTVWRHAAACSLVSNTLTHKAKGKVCHLFHTVCVCDCVFVCVWGGGKGVCFSLKRAPCLNEHYESLEGQSNAG